MKHQPLRSYASKHATLDAPSAILATCALAAAVSCGDKDKNETPVNPVSLPGNASSLDIGTKVGNGRVIETGQINVPTSTKWTRVYPIDKNRLVLAGHVEGEAYALITNDRGATWKAHQARADGIVTWGVGADGTVVLTTAKREIPAKTPPAGQLPPIDTLTFLFAPPDQPKISTPVPLLAPAAPEAKDKNPTIPRGEGVPAVLGPSLASVIVEMRPKQFAVAYAPGPGEPLPNIIELPKNETPIHAPYGHPPQLLSTNGKQLLVRPWPSPNEKLAEPKVLDKVPLTKTIESDLSAGAECEWGPWSFKRILQDKNQTYLLGISPDKTVYWAMPPTVVNTDPIGCNSDKIILEYIDNDKLPRVALCGLEGGCQEPQNRPFKPWAETHTRELHLAPTPSGMIAIQQMRTRVKWTIDMSESVDGGKNFVLQRPIGEGEGGNPEDGYDIGALIGMGDRALIVLSAKVSKTTRRSWYTMASDDNGNTWIMP